jgi:hypothetical protein
MIRYDIAWCGFPRDVAPARVLGAVPCERLRGDR